VLVETGSVSEVFETPTQDYTKALLDAIPGKSLLEGLAAPTKSPL